VGSDVQSIHKIHNYSRKISSKCFSDEKFVSANHILQNEWKWAVMLFLHPTIALQTKNKKADKTLEMGL
jgi:hypothetical protein